MREADAFVGSVKDAGVELVSLNFHTGDMAAGERGIVSHPARVGEFRENVAAAVEIAGRTGCTRLNAPYGLRAARDRGRGAGRGRGREPGVRGGGRGKAGASVLVEAINSVDIPGFPVDSSDKAMAVIREDGRAQCRVPRGPVPPGEDGGRRG